MRVYFFLIIISLIYCFPLIDAKNSLGGGPGDQLSHAALPSWYCPNVPFGNFEYKKYLHPIGVNLSINFDSPFPYLATCAFPFLGSQGQYHLFIWFQVLLILFSSLLVARIFLKQPLWQIAYVFFVWWSGYYFSKSFAHSTLLSNIWGFQFLLFCFLTVDWKSTKNILYRSLLIGLVFSGTAHNISLLALPLAVLFSLSFFKKENFRPAVIKNLILMGVTSLSVFMFFFWPMVYGYLAGKTIKWSFGDNFRKGELLTAFIPFNTNHIYQWLDLTPFLKPEHYNSVDLVVLVSTLFLISTRRFWSDRISTALLICGLFSYYYAMGNIVTIAQYWEIQLPFNSMISQIPPFSFSRTPGRFAALFSFVVTYLGFKFLAGKFKENSRIAIALLVWIFVTGPVMNRSVFFPTTDYPQKIPLKSLKVIADDPDDIFVFNMPTPFGTDPSQNYLALYHQKAINAGYLNYVAYNTAFIKFVTDNPFIEKIHCLNSNFNLEDSEFVVRNHFSRYKYRYIIINKQIAALPDCLPLVPWLRKFVSYPWIQIMEETDHFLILKAKDI